MKPMTRTPGSRSRMSIAIVISIAVHAVALAMVRIEIPTTPPTTASLSVIAAVPVEPPVEPAIQVIEIRPPGMVLPSGGSAPAAPSTNESTPLPAVAAARAIIEAEAATVGPRTTVELAPRAPETEFAEIVLAATPGTDGGDEGDTAFRPDPRPGRGVVLRQGGSDWRTGGAGTGTIGRGRGASTGGLTVTGTGGDCITPGLVRPGQSTLINRKDGGRTGVGRLRDAIFGGRGGIRPGG